MSETAGDAAICATLTPAYAASETWDAVIIGAGPAGASLAIRLASSDLRTLLVDRASFPRDKVCGSCLSGDAIESLRSIGVADLPIEPLRSAVVRARALSATAALRSGGVISRRSLDAALVRTAIERGAAWLPETTARLLPDEDRLARIAIRHARQNLIVRAGVVATADGLKGAAAGWAWSSSPRSRIGLGALAPACALDINPGVVELATARGGYVGFVRIENGEIDIAAAVQPDAVRSAGSPARAIERICAEAGAPIPRNLDDLRWSGTPLLTRRRATLADGRAFALGDAGGYVEPFTGEGISWALRGSAALAPLLEQVIDGSSVDAAREWARVWRREIGARQRACRVVAMALRSPTLVSAALRAINAAPSVASPVVHALGRGRRALA